MKKLILILLPGVLFAFFCSCQNPAPKSRSAEVIEHDSIANLRKRELPDFLSHFRLLPKEVLKLNFDGYDTTCFVLGESATDTLFVSYANGALAYGLLADTSRFYALLWYVPVENMALTLTLLDKSGRKLDEKMLTTGKYGWDCGYQWFGKVYIREDMSILMRDSIVTFSCDSGPAPESTWRHELDSMDGHINPEGKIEFSKVRQTKLD